MSFALKRAMGIGSELLIFCGIKSENLKKLHYRGM